MFWVLLLLLFTSLAASVFLFLGLIAVSKRNIKQHQFRMLSGFGTLSFTLLTFWFLRFNISAIYRGASAEAFGLLYWIQLGLGTAHLGLGGVTLWAVWEHSWELHRRTGMFAFFSGVAVGAVTALMIVMIILN